MLLRASPGLRKTHPEILASAPIHDDNVLPRQWLQQDWAFLRERIGTFVWTAESNRFGWTALLGIPAGSPKVPPGSVPARLENLAGLPPAFIVTGAIDLFVEEDIEYARRLIATGVPTELHVVPGAYHGYDLLVPIAKVSARFTDYWTNALRRALAPV